MNKKAFFKLSYGLYIVSSKKEDKLNGQIANTVFQITSEPPTIAVSINKQNLTNEFISDSKVFSVSILAQSAPLSTVGQFGFKSGREGNKFDGISYKLGLTGTPIELDHTVSYFEAEVIDSMDVGTHTIFIGKVIEAETISEEETMTYAFYHLLKQGKASSSSSNIPTVKVNPEGTGNFEKYRCEVCGYIYDPAEGDSGSGIAAGTAFEALPEEWVCPVCGVSKDQFVKE